MCTLAVVSGLEYVFFFFISLLVTFDKTVIPTRFVCVCVPFLAKIHFSPSHQDNGKMLAQFLFACCSCACFCFVLANDAHHHFIITERDKGGWEREQKIILINHNETRPFRYVGSANSMDTFRLQIFGIAVCVQCTLYRSRVVSTLV